MATTQYCLSADDHGHWYVIPVDRRLNWEAWIGTDDPVPAYAKAIGGAPFLVHFPSFTIG